MYESKSQEISHKRINEAITFNEIESVKKKIYVGMPVIMCDSYERMKYTNYAGKLYKTKIKTWFDNVIIMENNMSCTMVEMAKYLRDKSRALCS